jgi:hypothetical protein
MKKLILLLLTFTIMSCDFLKPDPTKRPPVAEKVISDSPANVERLMEEVGFGLNKVKVNDSTTVLIYRGTESCTMIQLK